MADLNCFPTKILLSRIKRKLFVTILILDRRSNYSSVIKPLFKIFIRTARWAVNY